MSFRTWSSRLICGQLMPKGDIYQSIALLSIRKYTVVIQLNFMIDYLLNRD